MISEARVSQVKSIREKSYFSEKDGCRVSLIKCDNCTKTYEEEQTVAEMKAERGMNFFCLACDEVGGSIRDIRAIRISIQIG